MPMEFALDVTIISLLIAVIVFGVVLHRRLGHLRDSRQEMEETLAEFATATARAEHSVAALKRLAADDGDGLLSRYDDLVRLRDDLGFLLERAQEQSAKLERLVREGRGPGAPDFSAVLHDAAQPKNLHEIERDLDAALFAGDRAEAPADIVDLAGRKTRPAMKPRRPLPREALR